MRNPTGELTVSLLPTVLRRLVPVFLLVAGCPASQASCFGDLTGDDAAFLEKLDRNPGAAIETLQDSIGRGRLGSAPGVSIAQQYAMLMDAYERTHEIDKARDAADKGLEAITPGDTDALRRRLRLTRIGLLAEQGRVSRAVQEYEAAAVDIPQDAPDYICVLMDLGMLHMMVGREGDALHELLRGYELADTTQHGGLRVDFGNILSQVYVKYGFFDDALSLENGAIQSLQETGDTSRLAAAYVLRGDALLHQEHLDDALASYEKGRLLYRQVHDSYNAAAASQLACAGLASAPAHLDEADRVCQRALREAQQIGDEQGKKDINGSFGEIELQRGHARQALVLLNLALTDHRVELPPAREEHLRAERAQARGRSGDTLGAWQDMNDYSTWQRNDAAARQSGNIAVLRAKFGFELKERELRQAKAEVAAARESIRRETLIRNVVVAAAGLTLLFVTLAVWLVRHRRELISAHAADRERVASLGRLAAGIAHEFNNALTVVQQAVGLLRQRSSVVADPGALELIEGIEQVSRESAATTAQLQSFGRQQSLRPRAFPLRTFLGHLRPRLASACGGGIRILIEVLDPEPCAWADEKLLADALLGLVHNARDAMSGRGTITIRAYYNGDQGPCIEVVDTGSGMPPEVVAHAAEPFFSTKPFGQATGLGLSMVDGFMQQSGGAMTILSEENHGTTVRLQFPPLPRTA